MQGHDSMIVDDRQGREFNDKGNLNAVVNGWRTGTGFTYAGG